MVIDNNKDINTNKIQAGDIVKGIIIYIIAFLIGLVIFLIMPIEEKYFGYFVSRFGGYLIMIYAFVYWRVFVQNRDSHNKEIKAAMNFMIVTAVCAFVFIIGPVKNEYLREMAESASASLENIGGVIILVVIMILVPVYLFEELIDRITRKTQERRIKGDKIMTGDNYIKDSKKVKKEMAGRFIGGYAAVLLMIVSLSGFLGIDYKFNGYEVVGIIFIVMTPLLYGYYFNKIRHKNKTKKMRYLIVFFITAVVALLYALVIAGMYEANKLKELSAIYAAVLGIVLMCVTVSLSFLIEVVQDKISSLIKGEDSEINIKKINICNECGEENRNGADFCGKCGGKL